MGAQSFSTAWRADTEPIVFNSTGGRKLRRWDMRRIHFISLRKRQKKAQDERKHFQTCPGFEQSPRAVRAICRVLSSLEADGRGTASRGREIG
jgi:hypothetical protein